MNEGIEVYDDVLPNWLFERVRGNVFAIPMRITRTANIYDRNLSLSKIFTPSGETDSERIEETATYESIYTTILYFKYELGIEMDFIYRFRTAIIFRDNEQRISGPHVDNQHPHKVALLYLDDTDGDTIVYENRFDYSFECKEGEDDSYRYLNDVIGGEQNLVVKKRISPKANRLIVFDGSYYHSSSTPTITQTRMSINYNFV